MNEILLFGAGGHARSCIEVIESEGKFRIAGIVGLKEELHQDILGYKVIGTDQDLRFLVADYPHALITVGQIKSPNTRIKLYKELLEAGFVLPVVVSPNAYVSPHAKLGNGSIVMNGAIINANARIGVNCIINSRALLEHDVEVGDHCHISTGAILNGNVRVGSSSFVGSGTLTKHGISIGAGCVVGMASVLRHDFSCKSLDSSGAENG